MRLCVIAVLLTTACTGQPNHLGNPLFLPISGIGTAAQNTIYNQRRGQVELIVKSNHPAIIVDIQKGGGPILTEAMDAAAIPVGDRPARIIQMQGDIGLYNTTPDALVVALMVYSN